MSRYARLGGLAAVTLLVSIFFVLHAASSARAPQQKYVIFHQWGGAMASDVAANAPRLERLPFDGTTMQIPASGTLMLGHPTSYEEMRRALAPVKGAFRKFTQNFVMVHTRRPPDVFDDWTQEVANWRNLAHAAREAGLAGICFDNEEYQEKTWTYPQDIKYPDALAGRVSRANARCAASRSWRRCRRSFPTSSCWSSSGPYLSDPRTDGGRANDLRGPFFVGMVEGAGPQATVVDGGELYGLQTAADFAKSYQLRKNGLAQGDSVVIPPSLRAEYPKKVSIAFATYNKQWAPEAMRGVLAQAIQALG